MEITKLCILGQSQTDKHHVIFSFLGLRFYMINKHVYLMLIIRRIRALMGKEKTVNARALDGQSVL